jgi:hypothetical protein
MTNKTIVERIEDLEAQMELLKVVVRDALILNQITPNSIEEINIRQALENWARVLPE